MRAGHILSFVRFIRLSVASGVALLSLASVASANFPGGFVEKPANATVRPKLTPSQIQSFLPARGKFTFPAPYNTHGVRISNASDCNGSDCVMPVGYSYWRNINNHVGSNTMYIFLGMSRNRGGSGPTLFSYNKTTDEVKNVGPLFPSTSPLSWMSGEGWYFSATQPTKMYINDGPRMLRYDVITKQFQTVYDVSRQFGAGKSIWQMHSSDDDKVHSATLRNSSSYEMLGCVIYREDTARFQYFPKTGAFDECSVDKSGRWAMSLEDLDHKDGLEMRVFNLADNSERTVWDRSGAVGHADMGHGYVVGTDNWNAQANAFLVWDFAKNPLAGALVSYNTTWSPPGPNHISHTNAKPGIPANQQYACGSSSSAGSGVWANEIVCFRMDGSFNILVAAPVMTDMNAAAGGDAYEKQPKGNLDVTGQYFIWTSNTGGSRTDAFIVKIPSQSLGGGGSSDTTAPSVAITSPPNNATISGSVTVTASASDNAGIAGVQFKLNGANLGVEDTTAPYSVALNTATTAAGVHLLTAVARDTTGNAKTSSIVTVTVSGSDTNPPSLSSVAASNITSSGATITWNSNEASNSQVEYGLASAYGNLSTVNPALVTSHSTALNGLAPSTRYFYRARSRDSTGNLAVSAETSFTTAAGASTSIGTQNVVWTSGVNVATTGNSVKKTRGCDGCADAGAVSQQRITSGSGYFEFTVSETTSLRYVGLTSGTSVIDTAGISYALKLVNGYAEVRERGQYRKDIRVTTGDVLRVAVQSGVIKYSKNGTVFYTSTVPAAYPLRVDAALLNLNATVTNAIVNTDNTTTLSTPTPSPGSTPTPSPSSSAPQTVAWTNRVNVTVSGTSLKKTSGCDGCTDAGAVSQQQISSGNGYMQFTVSETNTVRYIGLNNNSSGTGMAEIPFAFKLVNGYVEIRERGQYRWDTRVAVGDVLRIAVQSNVVKYSKNGTVIFTSALKPTYPLVADTALINLGATITNAVIGSTP